MPQLNYYVVKYRCCGSILSLNQILFPLCQTHYHQITITKTKEIKLEPRIKLNHNIDSPLADGFSKPMSNHFVNITCKRAHRSKAGSLHNAISRKLDRQREGH